MEERLSWKEIAEKYPNQWVGLADVEWEDEVDIRTAVVRYSNISREELLERQHNKEVICRYTTPEDTIWNGALMF